MYRGRYRLRMADREVAIPAGDFVVGRSADCQLRLEGGLVSRRHARLRPAQDGLLLEDLGSRNGVLVNERRIKGPTALVHGDVIGIGLESLEVIDELLLKRASHLSTLPPTSMPFGVSDVDGPDQETVIARLDVLSDREREVLELIVHGYTQKEMAERLHVSVKTIESHRARIAEKLGCRTRAELVAYAISAGLLRGKTPTPPRP